LSACEDWVDMAGDEGAEKSEETGGGKKNEE
jgi:hypothetical protein